MGDQTVNRDLKNFLYAEMPHHRVVRWRSAERLTQIFETYIKNRCNFRPPQQGLRAETVLATTDYVAGMTDLVRWKNERLFAPYANPEYLSP
jgi:dGTP triphosphohydrolase